MMKNIEKNHHNVLFEKEMIKEWLDYSNESKRYFPKPIIDKYTVQSVMYFCEKLDVERDVFFMTVDVIEKYLDITKKSFIELKEPILTVLILILICNKHTGQRSELSGFTILSILRKEGFRKYNLNIIQNAEKTIMKNLKCYIPLLSTMDDMNVLIEVFVKPEQLIKLIRIQCLDILNLFYLHAKIVTNVLDNIYSKNTTTISLLKSLYEHKLYIPAGILICTMKICKNITLLNYNDVTIKISSYTKISSNDLNLLSSIISNLIYSSKNNL